MSFLIHHGVKGQKWGVRRFQNSDGSLTAAGKKHYKETGTREANKAFKEYVKLYKQEASKNWDDPTAYNDDYYDKKEAIEDRIIAAGYHYVSSGGGTNADGSYYIDMNASKSYERAGRLYVQNYIMKYDFANKKIKSYSYREEY